MHHFQDTITYYPQIYQKFMHDEQIEVFRDL
jgi:hypothetical protein